MRAASRAFGKRADPQVLGATPDREILGKDFAASLEASRDAWAAGEKSQSLDHLRRALLIEPGRADQWFLYGQRSIELGRPDVAWDAIRSTLDLSAAHLDALELLIELVRVRDVSTAYVTQAVDRLTQVLPSVPQKHRESLDYLIPFTRTEAVRDLTESPDEVARGVARLYCESRELEAYPGGALAGLSAGAAASASVRYNLAVGRVSAVSELASSLPVEAVPISSVRRAIRRHASRSQHQQVTRLCDLYLAARPDDAWAVRMGAEARAGVLAETSGTSRGSLSNYQLTQAGFPFREAVAAPRYEAAPRRVFYLLHNSLPYASAGYATRSHGLLRALSETWDITGVTRLGFPFDTPGHDEVDEVAATESIDGVRYQRLSTRRGTWQKSPITGYVEEYAGSVLDLAETERPGLIHAASNHWNGLTAVQSARALGIPSVYEVRGLWEVTRASRNPDWHDSGMYRYIARMEADAARGASQVITITQGLRDELVDRGVDGDTIAVVPNGVDTERFVPVDRDVELAGQLGLHGKTVIGYVGSVLDYEGLDLLVRAVGRLATERDDFHLLVVGDGAERERYQTLADELGLLGTFVTFTGRVPHAEVERYYSLVDIAPFPRLPLQVCELVSPLKPFEAMAMGKAVIASDVRALAEIVTDGVNGLLHTKGSSDDLVRALRTLLDDPALRRRLGDDARAWVVAERDWRTLAGRVTTIYDHLLSGGSASDRL